MIKAKLRIAVAATLALVCATQALAQKTTDEFEAGTTRPKSIALLPVKASVTRTRVIETEGLVDESVVYGERFNEQVKSLLEAKGYVVQVIDADRINSDPKLQEYVVESTRGFDDMMQKYKPKKLSKRIYKVGDSARLLADYLHVDALGFSTLNVNITPMGKALLTGLFGGSASGASSNLEIVNGSTGELEAVFFGVALVGPGDKTDEDLDGYVTTLAEHAAKKVPEADPAARTEVAVDDSDVLDEAEAVLGH